MKNNTEVFFSELELARIYPSYQFFKMTREEKLSQIARKWGTDKIDHHSYIKPYSEYLPLKCRSLLEIGVAHGASAMTWDDFYEKDCDIFLLDLFLDPNHVSPRWCRERNFVPVIGDQSDLSVLSSVREKFEVIIDDGSHRADHMLISFKHLFLSNMVQGGQYYIEDCGTNKEEFYWGGLVTKYEETPIWLFKNYIETGKIVNPYFNDGEAAVFESMIESVKILDHEQLILIIRK